ncbi:MAG: FAD-dependent oxidoreductase, partial [Xanthobacteraceae bacterium]
MPSVRSLNIAVVGAGISGLAAAWLLSQRHRITVYERADRPGGHSNTISVAENSRTIPVDTGFIVFNRATYPNLTALFDLLEVPTRVSEMSFAVSLDAGALEYSGSGLGGLLAQPSNILRPRFWSMLAGLLRFYHDATRDSSRLLDMQLSLGEYLARGRYGEPFVRDHLLPMASAVWSAAPDVILNYP